MYNGCEASTRQTFALAIPEIFAQFLETSLIAKRNWLKIYTANPC